MDVVSYCCNLLGRKQVEECKYSWYSSRGEIGFGRESWMKNNNKEKCGIVQVEIS